MRPILFRGFYETPSGDNTIYVNGKPRVGEWAYGLLCNDYISGELFIHHKISDTIHPKYVVRMIIPETVGQYTGLDDINGVKIFEGDRITRINTYRKRETGIARFNSGCFCVERLGDHNEWEYLDCWEQFFKNCKVTGTIFDEELKEIKKAINDRR